MRILFRKYGLNSRIDEENEQLDDEQNMPFLNSKRLRDYPRLMLITAWLILGVNLLFNQGWNGAFGQLIGGDFIAFYSTGLIHASDPLLIYDYNTQLTTQQSLVSPTILSGYIPYINPPYVALFYYLWTFLPLALSLLLWSLLGVLSVILSVHLMIKLIPSNRNLPGLTHAQLAVVVFSFFPFVEGLQSGQNHWITLLLVTSMIYFTQKEKWYLAGLMAGMLIYKPQFVLGFLIVWLVWKNFKALAAFGAVVLIWPGIHALIYGLDLYRQYILLSQVFMSFSYEPGFPNYLLVTFYGLLTNIFPQSYRAALDAISLAVLVVSAVGLAVLAYRLRNHSSIERIPAIVAAVIFPLFTAPHTLLHDMVILIPSFILWAIHSPSRKLILVSAAVYVGVFVLTFLGAVTKFAWMSLIILGLVGMLVHWVFPRGQSELGGEVK